MSLEIISIGRGIYEVGRSDVPCLSGVTIIPVKLLENYFPGGVASYVEQSEVSQHVTELDGFLFVASGSYGYGISNESILRAAQFEKGKDFVNIQVGDSASGWYLGTRLGKNGALEIGIDPLAVQHSEHLRAKSESGRLKAISEITASGHEPEEKFKELIAQMDTPTPGSGKRIARAVEDSLYQIFRHCPAMLLPHVRHAYAASREAVATVLGRILRTEQDQSPGHQMIARGFGLDEGSKTDSEALRSGLRDLLKDPDTWVRIKATAALGDEEGVWRRISPLGNACIGLHLAVDQKWSKAEIHRRVSEIQNIFLGKLRRKIAAPEPGTTAWLKDPDLVSRHLAVTGGHAPQSHLHYNLDKQPGWKGDELYVSALNWFMSDTYRASFGVWPGRERIAFAVFDDAKGFDERHESFRIWRGEFASEASARLAIGKLPANISFCGSNLDEPWRLIYERAD